MTTIYNPASLDAYARNITAHGHTATTRLIVIGDLKTDPAIVPHIAAINRHHGELIDWWDYPRQIDWLTSTCPDLVDDIPPNTDNRRNVGYLIALSLGFDTIVSVDDDNFPLDEVDFVAEHAILGQVRPTVTSPTQPTPHWFNIMTMLTSTPAVAIWPRGFPYRHRHPRHAPDLGDASASAPVGVNAGLWLGDPDVDAITRLAIGPETTAQPAASLVVSNVFTPVNSQNTGIVRDLLPAYYYFRMHQPLLGWPVNRFGDIWQGLFVQKVAYSLGYALRIGSPLVRQTRNDHDLLLDLRQELPGVIVNEWLADEIAGARLDGSDAASCALQLHELIAETACRQFPSSEDVCRYFRRIGETGKRWVDACRKLR